MNRRNVTIAGAVGIIALTIAISGSRGGLRTVSHDSSLSGTGSSGSPLALAQVNYDGSAGLSGTGSAGSPLVSDLTETDFTTFGDGSDGDCNFDGTNPVLGISPAAYSQIVGVTTFYTLNRDVWCDTMDVASGVYVLVAGWKVSVRGTLNLNGYIGAKGNNASGTSGGGLTSSANTIGNGGAGGAGGAGSCAGAPGSPSTQSPGYMRCDANGGDGATSISLPTPGNNCTGGGGGGAQTGASCSGVGLAGGNGGDLTIASSSTAPWMLTYRAFEEFNSARPPGDGRLAACGTGGGGSRGGSVTGFGGSTSPGGGGGGGGGCVSIRALEITGSGTVIARGGNGAQGQCLSCTLQGPGGGGGGGGGILHITIGHGSAPTTDVAGGSGAAGVSGNGVGATTGKAGADGGSGFATIQRAGY